MLSSTFRPLDPKIYVSALGFYADGRGDSLLLDFIKAALLSVDNLLKVSILIYGS